MQVFQQSVTQHIVVGSGFDNRRNRFQTCDLRCAPTTFTHNELVHAIHAPVEHIVRLGIFSGVLLASSLNLRERTLPYDNRLQHADFFDGISKLTKIILIENGTRLMQVRSNITQSQFNEITALHRQQFRFVILLIFGLFYRSGFT